MTKTTLLQQLKEIRLAAGVCQETMANELRLTRQGYGHLESGARKIKLDQAEKAFDFLGFSLDVHPINSLRDCARENDAEINSKYILLQSLYRTVTAKPRHFLTLKRFLTELNSADWDVLNEFVLIYINNKTQREMLANVVRQFDQSYRE
jgi:DNA-binding XRE family transcriptional regulator